MKKIVSLLLVIVMAFSLVSCGKEDSMLTAGQKEVCKVADEFFEGWSKEFDYEFSKEIIKKEGKILYLATLDRSLSWEYEVDRFKNLEVQSGAEEILSKEDVYLVIYLSSNGDDESCFVDSKLDPEIFLRL